MKKNNVEAQDEKAKSQKKLPKKVILCVLVAIVLVIVAVFGIKKIFYSKDISKTKATYTDAFFIKNKKGEYALFNDKGKNITGFIYESAGKILNNSAFVMKDNNEYAVINNKGKEIIPAGKYEYLSDYNGFYKARVKDEYVLISSSGKEIIKAKDLRISTYGSDYPFAVVGDGKKYYVYTIDGKLIHEFKYKKDAKTPTVNHVNEYATVFYNKETFVIDLISKKVITTIKSKNHYCLNAVSDNKKIFTLNTCTSWFSGMTVADGHGVIYKDKFTDLSDKCKGFNIYENTVVCVAGDGAYFVNFKNKKASLGINVGNKVAFVDNENYAKTTKDLKKVEFYKNGKKVGETKGTLAALGKVYADIYILNVDGKTMYYKTNGKKAFDTEYDGSRPYDKNELALASEKNTYFLIDTKGKKVSNSYKNISSINNVYVVTSNGNEKGLLNSKGKEIIKPRYDSIQISEVNDDIYAKLSTNDKFVLYNVTKEKEIVAGTGSPSISSHYIKVVGKNIEYYNLKGKLIYTDK